MKKLLSVLLLILCGGVQLRAQNPNTAKFSAAIVADGDIGVAKNRARALLTTGINATDLTINVDNGAAFAAPSWGSIEQEYIKICSVAGNVITVCAGGRGALSTTAAAHVSGLALTGPLVAEHVNQLAAEVKAIETALGTSLQYVVQTGGSYNDPAWLTLSKAKVGLGNVENTALSTWAGSTNITTIGTLSGPLVSGSFTAKGRYGAAADNVARADVTFNARYAAPSWVRDDDTKSAAILALVDGYSDLYVSPAGEGNISWTLAFRAATDGDVSIPKRHQQISFSLFDPNIVIPASTIPGIWRPEYGAATVTAVSCASDTGDAVVQIKRNTSTDVLSGNLTCTNAGWSTTTAFAAAAFAAGDDVGLQLISGTAKRVNVSIKYTGN